MRRNVDGVSFLSLVNYAEECRSHSVGEQKSSSPGGLIHWS